MKKIAVIGGGVSGLVAAYLLRGRHDVRLFERSPRVGGHTLTVDVEEEGRSLAIDLGFIVFNDRTYPRFERLLDELGVASQPSEMSFSVRSDAADLEYNGSSLGQLFVQRRNLVRPSFLRMLLGIRRFHGVAHEALTRDDDPTLDDFLAETRVRGPVVEQYIKPMTSAIWSTEAGKMGAFPARMMVAFLRNHGMITIKDRPQWRVVQGGSRTYVDALCRHLEGRIVAGAPVESVRRFDDHVELAVDGGVERFDEVVLACHSDQALAMLADPSAEESAVLGAIPYQDNDVVLHTDASVLPRRRRAWASWNYHLDQRTPSDATTGTDARLRMTYYMNRLQGLDARRHYCVTLNRLDDIDPDAVLERRVMAHPQFTRAGVEAQGRWAEISGPRRTHYCGAYWHFGFHEDGVKSAVRVAAALGVDW